MECLRVLLPFSWAEDVYEYKSPPGKSVQVGQLVRVPVRDRDCVGVVWGRGRPRVSRTRLRGVRSVYEIPPFSGAHRRFLERVARHTVTPLGAVLRLSLSVPVSPREVIGVRVTPGAPVSPKQVRVLSTAAAGRFESQAALARAAQVSASVVQGLVKRGFLVRTPQIIPFAPPQVSSAEAAVLSKEQAQVARTLQGAVGGGFAPFLLDGVTGSGKTEVYFEAVAQAQAAGVPVLILLPEIALTVQFLERFKRRFGYRPSQWHSRLSARHRREIWQAVACGVPEVVVGARSALFLPFRRLGLVVVDEEHETSFRQEDSVLYHARDMAVLRASLEECPIVLSSATPSLESLVNVARKGYRHVRLLSRHGGGVPRLETIDLRGRPAQGFLSAPLRAALKTRLSSSEQSLLFLNRRGYSPLQVCRGCGYRLSCPHCDAWLVEHRYHGHLLCHYCGYRCALPSSCGSCGAQGRFVACGPGIERVAEEVKELFPCARVALLSGDLPASASGQREVLRDMESGCLDILVGTQIIAKGHNFPRLTLVGVVDGDVGLDQVDVRAAERTYQVLHQVTGRAGREGQRALGLIQTHSPDHPVMRALVGGQREAFLKAEIAVRRAGGWPPFGALVAFILSAPSWREVQDAAHRLARHCPRRPGIRVLGPAPAPVVRVKTRYRMRFLLKAPHRVDTQGFVREWLGSVRLPRGTRVVVDVDPFNFL